MPLPFLASVLFDGWPAWLPSPWRTAQAAGAAGLVALTKRYSGGARNPSARDMHGKVVLLTGGTSGIGAAVALDLAARGAQLVLLTRRPASDFFVAQYVTDLRARAGNRLVYAEQVDLADLHSVRRFATRWVDNAPPRRLDLVVLCAAADTRSARATTPDGLDEAWQVNFLANFHLLGILSPALRAQPFDRDVRVIVLTCSSHITARPLPEGADNVASGGGGGSGSSKTQNQNQKGKRKGNNSKGQQPAPTSATQNPSKDTPDTSWSAGIMAAGKTSARSKLALMTFVAAFQQHLDAYKRPDSLPMNARVFLVDPGLSRTPGTRRWLAGGSLWGLALYLLLYVFPWLLIKSPAMGAQSVLFAAMDAGLVRDRQVVLDDVDDAIARAARSEPDENAERQEARTAAKAAASPAASTTPRVKTRIRLIKECMEVDLPRRDVLDECAAKKLWEESDKLVERVETEQAVVRALVKQKDAEDAERKRQDDASEEIKELAAQIRKGKEREREREKGKSKKAKT